MKTITGATDTKTTGKVNWYATPPTPPGLAPQRKSKYIYIYLYSDTPHSSLNDAPGLGCYHVVVYEEYVNQATNPFTYYKCTPTLSVLSPASYFQTLTPGAVGKSPVNRRSSCYLVTSADRYKIKTAVASTPSYAPGETLVDLLLTITSAVRTSTAGTSTGPAARTGTTSKLPPTATTATPGSLSPDEDTASPSAEGLATSDKIAIGVGIGIGLPTILVGIMAWLYPRHRWGKGPVPVTFAVASSPSLQGPMQSLMQVGGGVATQGEGGYGGNGHNEGVAQGASRVFDGHAGEAVNQY